MVALADGAGRAFSPGARSFASPRGRAPQRSALRHRVRRALLALGLSEGQVCAARALKAQLEETLEARHRLQDSRQELREQLAQRAPDSTRLSELLLSERQLECGAQAAWSRLQQRLEALLTAEQVLRVHALPPEVLGDMLARLTGPRR